MNRLDEKFRFTWMEFSGSLGDLGLFIPLVAAIVIATDLDIGVVLILAGLMNVLTGWFFRQPIPVQPMKAIAVVVIAEGLGKNELVAAGIFMGILLVICSVVIEKVDRLIPKAIVRGIQFGIGLKLALKGIEWISLLSMTGWNSILSAVFIVCLLLILLKIKQPAALYIFLIGFVFLYLEQKEIFSFFNFMLPHFQFVWPSASAWSRGFFKGALPQLPLTVLNSVIAVCALSADYFPGRGIAPKRMAASIGLMNLLCVPFGGIPMCHGAGGLAAQYRFGARTGASVVMLGILKIGAGLLFGSALLILLRNYPMAVLGPLLIFAGIELAKSIKDLRGDHKGLVVALVTATFIVGINTLVGFLVGCVLAAGYQIYERGKVE